MITHLAAGAFEYGHYAIQRCAICGEALVKYDLRTIAVPEGSKNCGVSFWEPGSFVQQEGNRTSLVGRLECQFKPDDLPPDFCLWEIDLK